MFPIVLNGADLRIGVAGTGDGLLRRLSTLGAAGVENPVIYGDRLPDPEEIAALRILLIAGLDEAQSRKLAESARAAGVLVNVEDVPSLCDFHIPAQIRRGDLLVTVSTGGRAPGLARALREDLERHFAPEWDARLDEISGLRQQWRAEGASPTVVSERTRALLADRMWLA